jgi:hypothetical protein
MRMGTGDVMVFRQILTAASNAVCACAVKPV